MTEQRASAVTPPPSRPPARRPVGLLRCAVLLARGRRRGDGQSESGQVLPLAAIGLLATVLAVLATVNLSDAVYQKIKLQNTADSAAYTAAAMEARTFNYIAFLNRAQIAHYNTAMLVQSYITWVGSHVAVLGSAGDLITSLTNIFSLCADYWCAACAASEGSCGYCCKLCGLCLKGYSATVAPAFVTSFSAGMMAGIYQAAGMLGHYIVEAMSIFNYQVMWKAQAWRAVLMNGQLLSGFQGYIEKNDPDLAIYAGGRSALNTVVNSALNSFEYYMAFDSSAGVNPQAFAFLASLPKIMGKGLQVCPKSMGKRTFGLGKAKDGPREACQVMTQLVNASRYPQFVHRRGLAGASPVSVPFFSMSAGKGGTTRFLSNSGSLDKAVISELHTPGTEDEVGTMLASHDYFGGSLSVGASFAGTNLLNASVGDAILAWTEGGKHGPHYLYEPDSLGELLEGIDVSDAASLVNIVKGARDKISGMTAKVEGVWEDTMSSIKEHAGKAVGAATSAGKDFLPRPGGGSFLPEEMKGIEAALDKIENAIEIGSLALNLIQNAPAMVAAYIKKKVMERVQKEAMKLAKKLAAKLAARIGASLFGGGGLGVFSSIAGALSMISKLLSAVQDNFGTHDEARWPGFAPYFKFRGCADRHRDFCQPSTWIFLSKPYERFVKPDGKLTPSQSVFSWKQGEFQANIDTTSAWKKNIFMFEGLNALARGRVYYHCLGNWGEHPNFFNPCWRAQLAPIGQKLTSYFSKFAGDALGAAELPMGNQLQNFAAGAMGDLFAATVTSLVTH